MFFANGILNIGWFVCGFFYFYSNVFIQLTVIRDVRGIVNISRRSGRAKMYHQAKIMQNAR